MEDWDHSHLTACQKQQRENEPATQLEVPNRVEVCVTVDPGHV